MPELTAAVPILPARDPAAAAAWYRDCLGFAVHHVEDEYAIVRRDDVEVHFWGPSGIAPADSMAMCRIEARGIAALYETCRQAGIVHPGASLAPTRWGTEEFAIRDLDGNLVTFFEREARTRPAQGTSSGPLST